MTMTPATQRKATTRETGEPQLRTSYHWYAKVRTRVHEVGPAAEAKVRRGRRGSLAPRYVMFHGYCDSADTWRNLLAELHESGASAIAVDLPGFGEADPLRDGPILPQLDRFVAAVVREQAKYGTVILVGNSLGGTVSLRAAQNPSLPIAGVTSIAAPGFSDTWLVRTARRYPLPLRAYGSLPLPVPPFLIRGVADNVLPYLLYATPRSRDDADVRRFAELFPNNRAVRARLKQARVLARELVDCYEIDKVTAPLLVVACGKDRLVRPAGGKKLHTLVPHSRLLDRPDWGHCPQLDHAAEIHQLVTYFADSCTRTKRISVPAPRTVKRPDSAAG